MKERYDMFTLLNDSVVDEFSIRSVAARFEVAQSTVERWRSGSARPHPAIEKQVVRFLVELLRLPE